MSQNSNGFADMADRMGKLATVTEEVTLESLTMAAEFYLEKLIPNIPKSLIRKKHAADHVKVIVEDKQVKVVFEDTAFYWRFPENGTVNQPAQHFASGTFEQYKGNIENLMAKKVIEAMEGR